MTKMIVGRGLLAACALVCVMSPIEAQQSSSAGPDPVIVQPGAPGQPTKTLPSSTRATLPPVTPADVKFMQGMIMHHAQAVEMTALIESRTQNKELRTLGQRISRSQSDEMKFMKRWLELRGQSTEIGAVGSKQEQKAGSNQMPHTHGQTHTSNSHMLMPGMLTATQMALLRNAKDGEFDRLFLSGMIQHHNGALVMVKELFDTAGAAQDAELFNFVTDVDSGQRAEIRVMEGLLSKGQGETGKG